MPQTWKRLKRLEPYCESEIRSYLRPEGLNWRVVLKHRTTATAVTAEARDITDAVRDAVTRAEDQGWLPHPHPPLA